MRRPEKEPSTHSKGSSVNKLSWKDWEGGRPWWLDQRGKGARDKCRGDGRVQIVQDFEGHERGFPSHCRDFKQGRAEVRFTVLIDDSGCPLRGDHRAHEEKRESR